MRKEFILFDNDGVLVDTEKFYYQTSREILLEQGYDLTPELFNTFSLQKGVGVWEAFPDAFTEEQMRRMRTARNIRYRELIASELLVLAGVEEVLDSLSREYRLAIITTALREDFEAVHQRTGLLKYFEFWLTNGDYAKSKPAPDPYLKGIQEMGMAPEKGIVIEDTLRGVVAAKAAGIASIIIPNSFNQNDQFPPADYRLSSINEVPAFLNATFR